jgi:hypothetical protein
MWVTKNFIKFNTFAPPKLGRSILLIAYVYNELSIKIYGKEDEYFTGKDR